MNIAELGQKMKAKYPEYRNIPNEGLGKMVLAKYPEYNSQIDKGNILQRAGSALISNITRAGESLGQGLAGVTGVNKQLQESNASLIESGNKMMQLAMKTADPKLKQQRIDAAKSMFQQAGVSFAETLPSTQKTTKQVLGEFGGVAVDVLSMGAYGKAATLGAKSFQLGKAVPTAVGGVTKAVQTAKAATGPASITKGILKGAAKGAIPGSAIGAAQGGARAMQEGESVLRGVGTGAIAGGLIGGAIGGVAGGVSTKISNIKYNRQQLEKELVAKILRVNRKGSERDIQIGLKELSKLNPADVKNYQTFRNTLEGKIEVIRNGVDDVLAQDTTLYKPKDLLKVTEVGKVKVKENAVGNVLERLSTQYKKLGQPVKAEKARQLLVKFRKEGLTANEINQLARDWNIFGQEAFSKVGEPLTSVGAKESEALRKSLKELVRGTQFGAGTEPLDQQMGNLIRIKDLVDKSIQESNSALSHTEKMGLPSRVISKARFLWRPGEQVRGYFSVGTGDKILTIKEAEDNLVKYLTKLKKLQGTNEPNKAIQIINDLYSQYPN